MNATGYDHYWSSPTCFGGCGNTMKLLKGLAKIFLETVYYEIFFNFKEATFSHFLFFVVLMTQHKASENTFVLSSKAWEAYCWQNWKFFSNFLLFLWGIFFTIIQNPCSQAQKWKPSKYNFPLVKCTHPCNRMAFLMLLWLRIIYNNLS